MKTSTYSRAYIEITNICNMHCSFCHGHHREPRQMAIDEFVHILDQLEGKTKYIYYHLMGEPLIHPKLPLFLETAAKRGFHSMLTTNGTLLDQKGDAILATGVHKINISVHSFEQNDEQAFEKYLYKIVSFTEKAAKAGVIVVLRFWNREHDDGRNDKAIRFLKEHFLEKWEENTRGFRIRDKIFLEWGDRFAWPDMNAAIQGEEVFCYGLRDHFGILCDGSVVPCCLDCEGSIPLGNIFKEELSDILNSSRAQAIVNGFSQRQAAEELCRRCGYAQRFV